MKKAFSIAGLAAGGLCVVLGIVVLISNVETVTITNNTYGADFYTDSQNAMAAAANNISDLCDLVQKGLGFILIGLGLSDICFFGIKFAGIENVEKGVEHSKEEKTGENKTPETIEGQVQEDIYADNSETEPDVSEEVTAVAEEKPADAEPAPEKESEETAAADRAPLRVSLTDGQKREIIRILKAAKVKVEAGEMTIEEFKALKNKLLGI